MDGNNWFVGIINGEKNFYLPHHLRVLTYSRRHCPWGEFSPSVSLNVLVSLHNQSFHVPPQMGPEKSRRTCSSFSLYNFKGYLVQIG